MRFENFVIFRTQVTNFAPFVHSSARETHFAGERASEEKWNNVLRVQRMQIWGEEHFAAKCSLRSVYTRRKPRQRNGGAQSFSLYYSNVLRSL